MDASDPAAGDIPVITIGTSSPALGMTSEASLRFTLHSIPVVPMLEIGVDV